MSEYILSEVTITGTVDSPQTITFADESDKFGRAIPNPFSVAPFVNPAGCNADVFILITETPGVSSFKVAQSNLIGSALPSPVTCTFEIITKDANEFGTMTLDEMLTLLGIYLEDRNAVEYTSPVKIILLNQAQRTLVSKLGEHIIIELDEEISVTLNSDVEFDLLTLDDVPYRMEQDLLKVEINGGEICDKITQNKYDIDTINGIDYTDTDPKYVLIGSKIRILDASSVEGDTINLRYKKRYAQFVADTTAGHWETMKQEIIVGLACEPFINTVKSGSALRAYQGALANIEEIKRNTSVDDTVRRGLSNIKTDLNSITGNNRRNGHSYPLFLTG